MKKREDNRVVIGPVDERSQDDQEDAEVRVDIAWKIKQAAKKRALAGPTAADKRAAKERLEMAARMAALEASLSEFPWYRPGSSPEQQRADQEEWYRTKYPITQYVACM